MLLCYHACPPLPLLMRYGAAVVIAASRHFSARARSAGAMLRVFQVRWCGGRQKKACSKKCSSCHAQCFSAACPCAMRFRDSAPPHVYLMSPGAFDERCRCLPRPKIYKIGVRSAEDAFSMPPRCLLFTPHSALKLRHTLSRHMPPRFHSFRAVHYSCRIITPY